MAPVYVTRRIPDSGLDMLREAGVEFDMNEDDRVLEPAEMLDVVKGREAVLCLLTDRITPEVMDAAAGVKIFANYAVGYDNIDVAAATERGIAVTNTPGILTDTTADMTWALLMSTGRRIVEADTYTRTGKFTGWGPMLLLGQDITNATLGIVGAGRIGSAVARRAAGFDMRILYTKTTPNPELDAQGAEQVELDELLKRSDFVSLHTPLNDQTRHLIGERELNLMKSSAVLINTARGPVVDEDALVVALREKRIAAAGFDVYESEPALADGLADLPNVVLAPHIASASTGTRGKMAEMCAGEILRVLSGERPVNLLNPEALSG
jgi:glyoxylate reductase